MSVSREKVIEEFRRQLGREPESEEVILEHMGIASDQDLVNALVNSKEYAVRKKMLRKARKLSGGESKGILARLARQFRLSSDSVPENVSGLQPQKIGLPTRKLTVIGSCQAEGIARAMQSMVGDSSTNAFEATAAFLDLLENDDADLTAIIDSSDLIFVQEPSGAAEIIKRKFPSSGEKIRRYPSIHYPAYHPDIVYISNNANGKWIQGPTGDYQSAIAFLAYSQGLSVQQTISLFCHDVFKALGYLDFGPIAFSQLSELGVKSNFPIQEYLKKWEENGCWLYSVNHPKQFVLSDIARALMLREGIEILPRAIEFVKDNLSAGPAWPIYPEIAKNLGVQGDYQFKLVEGECDPSMPIQFIGLEEYIKKSFALYAKEGLENLNCNRSQLPHYQNLRQYLTSSDLNATSESNATSTHVKEVATTPGNVTKSPYDNLPDRQFWRRAIERVAMSNVDPVSNPGFKLTPNSKVATAGSCFAQHISRALEKNGFNYFVTENADDLSETDAEKSNYRVFSARFGNLYTARQLLQLFDRAYGNFHPADNAWARNDGSLVDPFRPQIEADGFASMEDLQSSRLRHFESVREMFENLDVFVFTLGLTEAWHSLTDGAVFPLAPGVAGGEMDATRYGFVNFSVTEVVADFKLFLDKLRSVNQGARVIITVSPVPLIATYEDRHVLVSTTASKAILRVAADEICRHKSNVDYFPSYEIITGSFSRAEYFENDLRSIKADGVSHVMRLFLKHYTDQVADPALVEQLNREHVVVSDIICDEEAIDKRRNQ